VCVRIGDRNKQDAAGFAAARARVGEAGIEGVGFDESGEFSFRSDRQKGERKCRRTREAAKICLGTQSCKQRRLFTCCCRQTPLN